MPRRAETIAAPRAVRQRAVPWRDLRLWAGLALVLVAMAAGSLVLGAPDGTVRAWRVPRDLAVGADVVAEPVDVPLGEVAGAYVTGSAAPAGTLAFALPAGSLVPRAALVPAGDAGGRTVTVPVDALHAPLGLAAGDRVDVWSTPEAQAGDAVVPPRLVLEAVLVRGIAADAVGVGGELPVALSVRPEDAGALVAAVRGGTVDLVAVPIGSPISVPTGGAPGERP